MSSGKGIMSSKVLSMKFMKQAEIREEEKHHEEEENKLKDLSEWKTSLAKSYKTSFKAKPKVITMGYTSINNLQASRPPIVGRRTFGEEEKPAVKLKKLDDEPEDDLASMWKKQNEDSGSTTKRYREESPKKSTKKRKSEPN